jgi:high affinity Mn2+ porin
MTLDWHVTRARGLVAEVERRFSLGDRPGAARVLAFANRARMGSYREAVADAAIDRDIMATRADGRTKRGVAASANQDLPGGVAAFVRVSWNDGANESWAFTEIDRSVALGVSVAGAAWSRPDDSAGLGVVASGLSDPHRRYLAAGGSGFLLGDGALHYGPEVLGEAWYRLALTREISLSVHYQPIINPAYNRDRGPVHVFTGLAHVEL